MILLLGCLACLPSWARAAPPQADTSEVRIQLKWKHQFQFAGYYAALEKGYYDQEGLNVRLIEGGPQHAPVAELLDGEVEYAVADAGILLDRAAGRDVVVLASIFQKSPQVLYTRADIASVAALRGRRVMLQDGFLTIEVLAMLQHFGVSQNDFVRQPIGSIEDLLVDATDAFPGYSTNEQYMLKQRGVAFHMFRPRDYGIDFYGDTLVTTGHEMSEHRERALAVRRATIRGWEYALAHPREIVDLIRRKYNSQRKSLGHLQFEAAEIGKLMLAGVVPVGFSNPERWQHVADVFASQGLLTRPVKLDELLYQPRPDMLAALWPYRYGIAVGMLLALALVLLLFVVQLRRSVARRTAQLQQVTSEYKDILDHMQDAYYRADLTGAVIWVSAACERQLGYRREEILGRNLADIYCKPEERNRFLQALSDHGGSLQYYEVCLRHKDGSAIPCEVNAQYFYDQDGRVAGVEGNVRNISERKRVQDEIIRARYDLKAVFDNMQDTFYRTDTEGRVTWASPSVHELTGYTLDELTGQHITMVWAYPEERERMLEQLAESGGKITHYEVLLRRKDGSELWASLNAHFTYDEDGNITGLEGIARDISDIKRAELENRQLASQFQQAQKMESIAVLAGGIAHDFNNLLVGVMGNAELAMLEAPEGSPVREYLQHIFRASQRGADLVRQMLAYSGQGRFTMGSHNLNECIRDIGDLLGSAISKKAEVAYELMDGLPDIHGDRNQLTQLLMNLMTNASDALGGEPGRITVCTGMRMLDNDDFQRMYAASGLEAGEYVYVSVADTGCGMDESIQGRIFDPFFTTKETGTGLGLAALLGIVTGHGGTLELRSAPGRGSRFTIYFPVSPHDADSRQMEETADFEITSRLKGTVLVVDDEPTVLHVASRLLEREGLSVLSAADGEEAVEVFRAHADRIGLVILDLTMPKMDGEQAFHAIHEINASVPVLLSSGFSESEAAERMQRHGLAGVISKPYKRKNLLAEVMRWGLLERGLDSVL